MTKKAQKRKLLSSSSGLGYTSSGRNVSLTIEQKEEAYKLMVKDSISPQVLANQYGCGVRQLQILKRDGVPVSKYFWQDKRNRAPRYIEVVTLTLKDCDNHRVLGHPLSGPLISQYAQMNAEVILFVIMC